MTITFSVPDHPKEVFTCGPPPTSIIGQNLHDSNPDLIFVSLYKAKKRQYQGNVGKGKSLSLSVYTFTGLLGKPHSKSPKDMTQKLSPSWSLEEIIGEKMWKPFFDIKETHPHF